MKPVLALLATLFCTAALAQVAPAPAPVRLPELKDLKPPPTVRALGRTLGLGRQRLALVISHGRVGGLELPAATRDARAVAAALEKAGYVVMPREDLNLPALRQAIAEFRGRLGPRGAGLVYVAGAGVRLDGQSLLLTRGLDAAQAADPAALRAAGLPLQELVEALQITPASLRLLVVDAAVPLPGLPAPLRGLDPPRLPEGVMALLATAPGAVLEPRAPPPLAPPLPADPRERVGSAFGSALVHALLQPQSTGPDALRHARRLAIDGTGGRQQPWLGGRTDEDDELGEPGLLQTLLPATPEDTALKAIKRLAGLAEDLKTAQATPEPARQTPEPVPEPVPAPSPAAVAGAAAAVAGAAAQRAQAEAAPARAALAAAQAQALAPAAAGLAEAAPRAVPEPAAPQTAAPAPPTAPQRPAAPVMNPYGYAVGDSFTYRRIDQWKGEIVGVVVQLIEQLLPDGEMLAQDEQGVQALDAQGRVRSRSGDWGRSEFQPVEEFFWSRPKRGESRDVKFTEHFQRRDARGERRWEGEVEVGRPTTLETPAGRFQVLPMEGEGWYTEINALGGRRSVMWERTVWYSPELGHPVAIDIVERDAGSRLLRKERLELLRVQTSRSVP